MLEGVLKRWTVVTLCALALLGGARRAICGPDDPLLSALRAATSYESARELVREKFEGRPDRLAAWLATLEPPAIDSLSPEVARAVDAGVNTFLPASTTLVRHLRQAEDGEHAVRVIHESLGDSRRAYLEFLSALPLSQLEDLEPHHLQWLLRDQEAGRVLAARVRLHALGSRTESRWGDLGQRLELAAATRAAFHPFGLGNLRRGVFRRWLSQSAKLGLATSAGLMMLAPETQATLIGLGAVSAGLRAMFTYDSVVGDKMKSLEDLAHQLHTFVGRSHSPSARKHALYTLELLLDLVQAHDRPEASEGFRFGAALELSRAYLRMLRWEMTDEELTRVLAAGPRVASLLTGDIGKMLRLADTYVPEKDDVTVSERERALKLRVRHWRLTKARHGRALLALVRRCVPEASTPPLVEEPSSPSRNRD